MSSESIAQYRAMVERIGILYADNVDAAESGAFLRARERFLEGSMPMESFIGELERRYVMRSKEQG